MLSFPRSEPTDEGKPQPTHGRLGSAHELDVDPIDGPALYNRQRRLRLLVFAVLLGAVVLLLVAVVRQTARQLSTSPDATAGIDSGAPASQAATAEAATVAPEVP